MDGWKDGWKEIKCPCVTCVVADRTCSVCSPLEEEDMEVWMNRMETKPFPLNVFACISHRTQFKKTSSSHAF